MSRRTGEGSDSDGQARARVGLSDYTSQKLAEIRARRAMIDADYTDYKTKARQEVSLSSPSSAHSSAHSSPPSSAVTTPTTAASTTMSTSDLLESYRVRRGLPSSKPDYSTTNGTALSPTNGVSSTHKPPITSKPTLSSAIEPKKPVMSTMPEIRKVIGLDNTKLSNGHGSGLGGMSSTTGKSGSASLSGASFSKADYGSSRGSHLEQIKTTSTNLSRSNSARIGPVTDDDDECVGFASLPEQVHRKAVKRGFDFTLMVVGETGLGKSTLISSLFLNPDLYKDREITKVQERISKTVEIERKYMEIEEKGVKLRLTIVDTPGFNDSMDGELSWRPIEEYINQQFDQFYKDESGLNRKNIKDHRVHCCLYFVSPYGHGLRQIDIQFMKRLHDKVNIVPIIAKADTLTPSEVQRLKTKILDQVEENNIKIYEFPDCDSDEDEEFKQQDAELKAAIPFAVIGSNTVVEVAGRKVRGRLYPWGVVEVDNPQHCDFCKLRMMLISTHMQDLKDVTRDVHYENFRARHIKEQMTKSQRERNKLKRDSSPNFESIVDQDGLLQQKDDEIRRMQDMIVKMQAELHNTPAKSNGALRAGLESL